VALTLPQRILKASGPRWLLGLMAFGCGAAAQICGGAEAAEGSSPASAYRLAVRDQIEVTVFEEPDLNGTQRIDAEGQVRLGLIGTVMVAGRTIREAEEHIQQQYVEQRFLRQPMVTIRILEYAPREAMVNGAVLSPGSFAFPPEAAVVDIVEVITKRGGFKTIARDNSVRVTRFSEKGRETFTVPVRDMMLGRTTNHFFILPGDVIYVDD
jgi:protein involved in polysaccharide export with SLBB domain